MKVLIVSVGDPVKPIVTAITEIKPDYVYFICSESGDGKKSSVTTVTNGQPNDKCECCGKVRREGSDSVLVLTGLEKNSYEIVKVSHDEIDDVFAKVIDIIKKHLDAGNQVYVDYSGGTKSMSVGCAVAAMEHIGCYLSVVAGSRVDLKQIKDGMQEFKPVRGNRAYLQRQIGLARGLLQQWDYSACLEILKQLVRDRLVNDGARWHVAFCEVLADWDMFLYSEARTRLNGFGYVSEAKEYLIRLNHLSRSAQLLTDAECGGEPNQKKPKPNKDYALVYDLLLNADRRAFQGLYDDAIARIYRAIEMYAQFCLIDGVKPLYSSDLCVEYLPDKLKEEYEAKRDKTGKIKLALLDNYRLLVALEHPAGVIWQQKENLMLDKVLRIRNNSFLAHGIMPLTKKHFDEARNVVWEFIGDCDKALEIENGLVVTEQLPKDFLQDYD